MDPDQQQSTDFDFSQLDQQVNKIMSQTQTSATAKEDNVDQVVVEDTHQSEVQPAETSSTGFTAQRSKPRGFATDVIHPNQSNMRPIPSDQDKDEPALSEGGDYLLPTESKPEEITSGYGAGGFSGSVDQEEAKQESLDTIDSMTVSSISDEKEDLEDAIKEFEETPTNELPASQEDSVEGQYGQSQATGDSVVDGQNDETETKEDNNSLDEIDSTPQTGALLANNLTNSKTGHDDASKSQERPAMFGTSDYVAPLKVPTKTRKNSDKPWVIALILLIIILIGIIAGYYLFILQR